MSGGIFQANILKIPIDIDLAHYWALTSQKFLQACTTHDTWL